MKPLLNVLLKYGKCPFCAKMTNPNVLGEPCLEHGDSSIFDLSNLDFTVVDKGTDGFDFSGTVALINGRETIIRFCSGSYGHCDIPSLKVHNILVAGLGYYALLRLYKQKIK